MKKLINLILFSLLNFALNGAEESITPEIEKTTVEVPVINIEIPKIKPPKIVKSVTKEGTVHYKLSPKDTKGFKENLHNATNEIIRGTIIAEREVHKNTIKALNALIENYSTINATGQALEGQLTKEINRVKKHAARAEAKFTMLDKTLENFDKFIS